jgi:hypothetical protein
VRLDDIKIRHFSALGEELARPTPVHKRRRFVKLVKDAKSSQIGMETAAIWGM